MYITCGAGKADGKENGAGFLNNHPQERERNKI
jgi:hypothetical protein